MENSVRLAQIAHHFNRYRDAEADLSDAKIRVAQLECRHSNVILAAISWARWILSDASSPSSQLRDAYAQRKLALERHISVASDLIHLLPTTLLSFSHIVTAEEYSRLDSNACTIQ